MECKECRSLVMPFIKDEIPIDRMDEFLSHIRRCKKCNEELEIYYIIENGLDMGNIQEDMDFEQKLSERIRSSYARIHLLHSWMVFRYSWNTLIALSVLLALCIQLRLWMETL